MTPPFFQDALREFESAINRSQSLAATIYAYVDSLVGTLFGGINILTCGNGESAPYAPHSRRTHWTLLARAVDPSRNPSQRGSNLTYIGNDGKLSTIICASTGSLFHPDDILICVQQQRPHSQSHPEPRNRAKLGIHSVLLKEGRWGSKIKGQSTTSSFPTAQRQGFRRGAL